MKSTKTTRMFSLSLAALVVVGTLLVQSAHVLTATAAGSDAIKLTGYIIDEDCFVKAGYSDPGKESRGCLSMKTCASSGYGLAVLQNGGTYKFYYFDGTFAQIPVSTSSSGSSSRSSSSMSGMDMASGSFSAPTAVATDGQALAASFITDKITKSNIPVTVSGTLTQNKALNPNPKSADGVSYQVLKVDSIETATEITPIKTTLTGYLSDAVSFLTAHQNRTEPTVETKETLQSSTTAANGYGVVVKNGDTYRFYYLDGDFAPAATGGQASIVGVLTATKKNSQIEVTVTGEFEGHYGIYKDTQSIKYASPTVKVISLAETITSSYDSSILSASSANSSLTTKAVPSTILSVKSITNPDTGEDKNATTPIIIVVTFATAVVLLTATVAVKRKASKQH